MNESESFRKNRTITFMANMFAKENRYQNSAMRTRYISMLDSRRTFGESEGYIDFRGFDT